MDALIEQFIDLLQKEIDLLLRMQQTLACETDAILFFNAGRIGAAHDAKRSQAIALKQLETERIALLASLSACLPDGSQGLSLTALLRRLPSALAERLAPCHTRLRELLPRVQASNRRNQVLLNQALGVVQGALALLGHPRAAMSVYRRSGVLERCHHGGAVLSGAM